MDILGARSVTQLSEVWTWGNHALNTPIQAVRPCCVRSSSSISPLSRAYLLAEEIMRWRLTWEMKRTWLIQPTYGDIHRRMVRRGSTEANPPNRRPTYLCFHRGIYDPSGSWTSPSDLRRQTLYSALHGLYEATVDNDRLKPTTNNNSTCPSLLYMHMCVYTCAWVILYVIHIIIMCNCVNYMRL